MELTTRGRYAVMAMAELARHEVAKALPLSQIAESQKLPLPYLEQLFLNLRRANLVESARGRAGGYRLSRPASEISVADVMAAVEEETQFTRCAHEPSEHGCIAGARCLTHSLWKGLSETTAAYLASVSLTDIVQNRVARLAASASALVPAPETDRKGAAAVEPSRIYLDHNATVPMLPEAKLAMIEAFEVAGNPSSVHAEGRRARAIVERAREQVAALVGAKPSEVVFTSGASEANAWALAQPAETIFFANIEHDSVLAPLRQSKAKLIELPVGADGRVAIEEIARHWLSRTDLGSRATVVLQMANNETGVLQPVDEMADFAREHGLRLHADAVQAAGRLPIDFATLPATTMALSAHKLGGPKGVGALIIRDRVDLEPLIRGGGQERRRRAGTENVAAIAGFGAAAHAVRGRLDTMATQASLRDRFEDEVKRLVPDAVVLGSTAPRLANTSCIAFPGRSAESLLIKLDLAGIAVSAGAACSSGKVGTSHVLAAMGVDAALAKGAIRISLGAETTQAHISALLNALKTMVGHAALAA